MSRIAKRTSTCAGIALWAFGCSSPAPEPNSQTIVVIVSIDGGSTSDPLPDVAVISPVSDAEVCNQPGSGACDGTIGAMCLRFGQCCQSITSCDSWATDVARCKAHFAEAGLNCASSEFTSKLVCASVTNECQNDVPLVACSDIALGTANWPAPCSTFWAQFK